MFDVNYDAEEFESRISEGMIRLLDGNLEVVALLLEKGADPDLADKVSSSQVRVRWFVTIPYLLEVNWSMILQNGKKPVDVAAEKGRADIESLLKKWAALNKVTTIMFCKQPCIHSHSPWSPLL